MTQHQIDGKGYFNKHPYNNRESRWCDLNEVPYARNGYLYGSETIEDQITGITYYQIDGYYNNTNLYRSFHDGTVDPSALFKEGDTLLIRHQQADVRFKITEFSPRAKNMVGTRYLNVAWHWDQEGWSTYKKKHLGNEPSNWKVWDARNAFWTTGSVLAGAQPDKIARPWSWTAVTKETLLRLQLLGYQ